MTICNPFIHSQAFLEAVMCRACARGWGTETIKLQSMPLGSLQSGGVGGQQSKYLWNSVTGDTRHCTGGSGAQAGPLTVPKDGGSLQGGHVL